MINNVLYYLEKDVEVKADAIALIDDNKSYTYREYGEKAKRIGSSLIGFLEGKTNKPIAVIIDRNAMSIITFMGVVYSGNFYVPLDVSMPRERVNAILSALGPAVVIDARENGDIYENSISVEELLLGDIDCERLRCIRKNMIDTDPLYAIFTSGSTGVPKGVLVSHKSVIDLVEAFDEAFDMGEGRVFGNQAPFDFDVSVKDIYNALYLGSVVVVIPKKCFMTPVELVDYLCKNDINTLIWAVSALKIISDFKALERDELPKLKDVMFSGEVMPVKSLNYWRNHYSLCRFVNLYGPTEITCNCLYYIVDRDFSLSEKLPIGKPFKNTRIILKNQDNKTICEPNELGEICVAGTCVALGYWNEKERTAEAFIQNPNINSYNSILYSTGDLGVYDSNGDIVFISRKDNQIKHMGHRIELGEVEVALNAIDFIKSACCIYDSINEKIVCFYSADEECKKEIVMELVKKLPKYMWPNVYKYYVKLPQNKNGKIDRAKLKETLCEE